MIDSHQRFQHILNRRFEVIKAPIRVVQPVADFINPFVARPVAVKAAIRMVTISGNATWKKS
jgi:hypothetical protein